MAKRHRHSPTKKTSDSRGAELKLSPITKTQWKRSIRGICKDLVGQHSTEIAMRLREGMLTRNLRLALKYLQMVAAYESGKPVETHRMVGLNEGPTGAYDLSKLAPEKQKQLLALLRDAKDSTKPRGDV